MSDAHRPEQDAPPAAGERGASLWRDALVRLRRNHLAVAGLVVLFALLVVSLLTPWIAPYGYEEQDLALGAVPPDS
ncbi:MAG TPA: hypothetical protein PLF51_19445, partial [Candidatus Hydrogenedentes bacterium]|nr:hypothetical protein [Candidatus Hydrogenedentota bacterium]